jgi:hypothetical protein
MGYAFYMFFCTSLLLMRVLVVASVQHLKNSTEMEFVVTDLANEVGLRLYMSPNLSSLYTSSERVDGLILKGSWQGQDLCI